MQEKHIELVTDSFGLIQDGEMLVEDFYNTLFTHYPATEAYFAKTDMTVQRQKLLKSLNLVVQNLRHPNVLKTSMAQLGKRHKMDYGTLEEHYPMVGEALLGSLANHLGDDWTPEVEIAWTAAYTALVEMMTNP